MATGAVSFSAILIRVADPRDGAPTIVWVRMALAVALLAPALALKARSPSGPARDDVLLTLASGACLAVHFLTWTASLFFTSVAASVLLVSVHPAVVGPAARLALGERITPRLLAGTLLALAGTVVTCAGDLRVGGRALLGDGLALVGAVTVAGYLVLGRSLRGRVGTAPYSATCYAVVAVVALGFSAAGGNVLPHPRTLLAGLGLALVCTILGHTAINWTLHRLRALTVSLALLGEPPITAALALLLLAQRPPLATLLGGLLILTGLVLALLEGAERPPMEVVAPTVA